MTDLEKKAEEYVVKEICQICKHCQSYGYKGCEIVRKSKQAYIDGHEEGQKEKCKNCLYSSKEEMKKEIEELKKDKDYLDKVNNEQTEVILKLNEQNEKMKCCQNCELYDCTLDCKHTKCKYQYSEMCRDKTMNDKWELKKNER